MRWAKWSDVRIFFLSECNDYAMSMQSSSHVHIHQELQRSSEIGTAQAVGRMSTRGDRATRATKRVGIYKTQGGSEGPMEM